MKILHKLLLKTAWLWSAGCVVCLLLIDPPALFAGAASEMPLASTVPTAGQRRAAAVRVAKARLPVYFIENRGQVDARVAYYVHGANKIFYFGSEGVTMALSRALPKQSPQPALARVNASNDALGESSVSRVIIKLDFVGANPAVKPVGEELSTARFSYFKGRREDWATGLKTYNRLAYRDLWPGIDLVYSGSVDRLKYLFVVKPGADPTQIRLRYRGAESVSVDLEGRLLVQTALEDFHDDKPIAYQELNGRAVDVATNYTLSSQANAGYLFGFNVGTYDPSKALVIDPVILVYSGFLGGSGDDRGNAIAVDSDGSAYITGETNSTQLNFPTVVGPDVSQNGGLDAFVAKVDPTGNHLLYAGFIGGSGDDRGNAIAVDSLGNAYITGETNSTQTTFPVTAGPDLTHNGLSDAFVAKVNASGTSLVYAGYIGGFGNDRGTGIAVDGSNRAYVTGETDSSEASFPDGNGLAGLPGPAQIQRGGVDAFVAKINSAGSALIYAGFIGGSSDDRGNAIALTPGCAVNCEAFIAGETSSTQASFPVSVGPDLSQNGGVDAFVAKVNGDGSLGFAGYVGGSGDDRGKGIAVDGIGAVYLTGETNSNQGNFPIKGELDRIQNLGFDVFVAKFCVTTCADVSVTKSDTPDPVTVGTNVTYTMTITNNGPDIATDVELTDTLPGAVALVSATPSAGSCTGTSIIVCDLGSLANGASATVIIVVGTTAIGTLTNTASVSLAETDTNPSNNVERAQTAVTLADLAVKAISTVTAAIPGSAIVVNDTTLNNGKVAAGASTTSFFLCTDSKFAAGDVSLGSRAIPALSPKQSSAGSTTVTIPLATELGRHFIIGVADADSGVAETKENNAKARALNVTQPDLFVQALRGPSTAAAGANVVIDETTSNKAAVPAGGSTTGYYLSIDAIFDGADVLLGSRSVGALAAKGKSAGSTTVTIPLGTTPGKYFLLAVSDAAGAVAEVDESNNVRSRSITITP